VVVLTAFDFSKEIMGCLNIRNNGILELSDLGFKCVAAIEEDNIIAALFYKLIYLFRAKMNSTADDTIFIYLDLIRVSKCN
jgi:hypothetical protein